MKFQPGADDRLTCTEADYHNARWTLHHYLFECDKDWDLKADLIPTMSLSHLFSMASGGRQLGRLLHLSQAFAYLNGIPRPDPLQVSFLPYDAIHTCTIQRCTYLLMTPTLGFVYLLHGVLYPCLKASTLW
jgi:hypothetical protein